LSSGLSVIDPFILISYLIEHVTKSFQIDMTCLMVHSLLLASYLDGVEPTGQWSCTFASHVL
jgi:hypothetical protein